MLSTPFKAQGITLSALPPLKQGQGSNLLCPVKVLIIYIKCSAPFRQLEQLFVCFGGHTKGSSVTKQRLSRWIIDSIKLAYSSLGQLCPRTSSWAWSRRVSIAEKCAAASWASPSTFARFYNLEVPALQARVFSA